MTRTITAIPESWTDAIVDLGASSRDIKMHLKVQFSDGATEWHYYGTPIPDPLPQPQYTYVEHPAIHFPIDVYNLDNPQVLYAMAFDVLTRLLQI